MWTAKWWTQGDDPAQSGEWGVWSDDGACTSASTSNSKREVEVETGSGAVFEANARMVRRHAHVARARSIAAVVAQVAQVAAPESEVIVPVVVPEQESGDYMPHSRFFRR